MQFLEVRIIASIYMIQFMCHFVRRFESLFVLLFSGDISAVTEPPASIREPFDGDLVITNLTC